MTHHFKGLEKRWWLMETGNSYHNPKENHACMKFDVKFKQA